MKKYTNVLFILLIIFLYPLNIAKADIIDTTKKGNINIHYEYENNKIENIDIEIYKIANLNNNEYEYLDRYNTIKKDINNMTSSEIENYTKEIEEYINTNNIVYTQKNKTNSNGLLNITNLDLGLYLIKYNKKTTNNIEYNTLPVLIELPLYNENSDKYIYDLDIYPKVETTTISPNNEIKKEEEKKGVISKILSPKTGDNIIIYFILLIISLLGIITVVLYRKRSRKKENNEKNI